MVRGLVCGEWGERGVRFRLTKDRRRDEESEHDANGREDALQMKTSHTVISSWSRRDLTAILAWYHGDLTEIPLWC